VRAADRALEPAAGSNLSNFQLTPSKRGLGSIGTINSLAIATPSPMIEKKSGHKHRKNHIQPLMLSWKIETGHANAMPLPVADLDKVESAAVR
jgi:hypothetical protein